MEFRERRVKGREQTQKWADWTWHQPWHPSRDKSVQAFPLLFILQATKAGHGGLGTRLGLSTAEPRHGYAAVCTLRVHPPNSPNPFCSQRTYLARSDIMKLKCLMTYTWNQWASYYLSMNIIYLVLMVSVCCLWGCRAPRVFWEGLLTSQILSKNYELLQKTSCLAVRVSKSEHCVALLK